MNINPSKNEIDFVREALMQFNNERVGADGHTPLNFVEYDANGNMIGILPDIPKGNQKYLLQKALSNKILNCEERSV